jgi:hypothetical protein
MTVQIEIPDGMYSSLQSLAKVSGRSQHEILQSYVDATIEEFMERLLKERYNKPVSAEQGLAILRKYAGNEPPIETDIIE